MPHDMFNTYSDHTGAMLAQCDTCGERYTFKSAYFAKQWMNRHGGVQPRNVVPVGLA